MNIVFNASPALVIGLLVSLILPLLVGLITTRVTSSGLKAVLLAAASALTGLLTELGNAVSAGTPYDLATGLGVALTAFLIAVGIHFGFWKPTGASAVVQSVGDKSNGAG